MGGWGGKPSTGHYIRSNESSRLPRRHIVIDTEATFDPAAPVEEQTWRCASVVYQHLTDRDNWRVRQVEYTDIDLMWKEIIAYTRPKRRTILWAHNLAYDLRTSAALVKMEQPPWRLEDIRLASQGTWAKWTDGSRTLFGVDSASVWPCSLAKIARALGESRPDLPTGDDMDAWLKRAAADTRVLAVAVREYMTWLRDADMGTWQISGPGQSWAAWRHRFYTHKILVSDDLGARTAERRAMWTGRAEAWVHGTDTTARVIDLDFRNAYARIAHEVSVPVRQASVREGGTLAELLQLTKRYAVLAEVDVETSEPAVPTLHDGRILWPTGQFRTVLWDPELRLLDEAGAGVQVGRVWLYRKAPALKTWARWILAELDKPAGEIPEWRRIVLKHWSRALIGRFAMRYKAWAEAGEHPDYAIRVERIGAIGDERPVDMLHIGHRMMTLSEEIDGANAVPSITGYIMSEARRRLWNAARRIGPEHVLYVDTDSLLVDSAGLARYRQVASEADLAGLRVKGQARGWSIAGPRQLVIGGQPRIAGVPKNARRTGEWRFEGETWRGLGESINRGEPDRVRVTKRVWRVRGTDKRRVGPAFGRTEPIHLEGGVQDAPGLCDG